MNKLVKFVLMGAGTLLIAACGDTTAEEGSELTTSTEPEQVLNWISPQEFQGGDSSTSYEIFSFNQIGNYQEGLYEYNDDDQPTPAGITEEAVVSEDGLTYTFKLREDAQWSNGEPVTAQDYVYAWQRAINPDLAAPNAYLLYIVKNGENIHLNGQAPETLGITAIDDFTLEVQLEYASPYFKNMLISPIFYPLNEDFVTEQGDDYGTSSDTLLSNGPFSITEWDNPSDQSWEFVANESYHSADEVALDRVNVEVIKEQSTALNLYESGQADIVYLDGELAKQYQNSPEFTAYPTDSSIYVEFGTGHRQELKNSHLRKALNYAVDREGLVNNLLADGSKIPQAQLPAGLAADPETAEDFTEVVTDPIAYDPDEAQAEWEIAKEELGVDTLSFELVVDETDSAQAVAEYVQGQIQQILPEIEITIRPMPAKQLYAFMKTFEYDLGIAGWAGTIGDPVEYYDTFMSDSPHNHTQMMRDDYDQMVADVKLLLGNEPQSRFDKLVEVQNFHTDNATTLPLYISSNAVLLNPRVEGLQQNVLGPEFIFKNVKITE